MFIDKIRAHSSPSIALQRIILLVFASAVGAMLWWQHEKQSERHPVRKFEAAPLAEGVADLDFAAAEAAWSDLIIDAQGRVEINAKAELALSEVVALMSDEAFDVQMNRMGLLLEKQFGTVVSEQLVGLLPVLKKYKDLEQRWWEENGNTIPPAYTELFQLQDEVLGETLAERLFSEQRQLANVMLASFQIQNDDALTQSEKEQALADLQRGLHPGGQDE